MIGKVFSSNNFLTSTPLLPSSTGENLPHPSILKRKFDPTHTPAGGANSHSTSKLATVSKLFQCLKAGVIGSGTMFGTGLTALIPMRYSRDAEFVRGLTLMLTPLVGMGAAARKYLELSEKENNDLDQQKAAPQKLSHLEKLGTSLMTGWATYGNAFSLCFMTAIIAEGIFNKSLPHSPCIVGSALLGSGAGVVTYRSLSQRDSEVNLIEAPKTADYKALSKKDSSTVETKRREALHDLAEATSIALFTSYCILLSGALSGVTAFKMGDRHLADTLILLSMLGSGASGFASFVKKLYSLSHQRKRENGDAQTADAASSAKMFATTKKVLASFTAGFAAKGTILGTYLALQTKTNLDLSDPETKSLATWFALGAGLLASLQKFSALSKENQKSPLEIQTPPAKKSVWEKVALSLKNGYIAHSLCCIARLSTSPFSATANQIIEASALLGILYSMKTYNALRLEEGGKPLRELWDGASKNKKRGIIAASLLTLGAGAVAYVGPKKATNYAFDVSSRIHATLQEMWHQLAYQKESQAFTKTKFEWMKPTTLDQEIDHLDKLAGASRPVYTAEVISNCSIDFSSTDGIKTAQSELRNLSSKIHPDTYKGPKKEIASRATRLVTEHIQALRKHLSCVSNNTSVDAKKCSEAYNLVAPPDGEEHHEESLCFYPEAEITIEKTRFTPHSLTKLFGGITKCVLTTEGVSQEASLDTCADISV